MIQIQSIIFHSFLHAGGVVLTRCVLESLLPKFYSLFVQRGGGGGVTCYIFALRKFTAG